MRQLRGSFEGCAVRVLTVAAPFRVFACPYALTISLNCVKPCYVSSSVLLSGTSECRRALLAFFLLLSKRIRTSSHCLREASRSARRASHVVMEDPRRTRAGGIFEPPDRRGSKPVPDGSNKEKSDTEALSSRYIAYLRSIKDNWSSCHAARLLTPALLVYIHQRFLMLSTPLKVRVLTSFLYLRPALVSCSFSSSHLHPSLAVWRTHAALGAFLLVSFVFFPDLPLFSVGAIFP